MARTMSLAGQVDVAFEELMLTLASPEAVELVRTSLADSVGVEERAVLVSLSEPEQIASGSGRLKVHWQFGDASSAVRDGDASVQLFALRSGSAPLTELAVTMTVDDEAAQRSATAAHRVLDALAARLTR